jgi:hypothetical protein
LFFWFQLCFIFRVVIYKWCMRWILNVIFLNKFLLLNLLKIEGLWNLIDHFQCRCLFFLNLFRRCIFMSIWFKSDWVLVINYLSIILLFNFRLVFIGCCSNYLIHPVNLSKICYFLTVTYTFASALNCWFFKFFFNKFLYLYIHY